jgi:hypothetical protein
LIVAILRDEREAPDQVEREIPVPGEDRSALPSRLRERVSASHLPAAITAATTASAASISMST